MLDLVLKELLQEIQWCNRNFNLNVWFKHYDFFNSLKVIAWDMGEWGLLDLDSMCEASIRARARSLRRGQEATVAVGGKSGCEPSVGDYGPIG
jgi:midasin (ATPase involved in ribosome maturation)